MMEGGGSVSGVSGQVRQGKGRVSVKVNVDSQAAEGMV
jgi:hypothetical protein